MMLEVRESEWLDDWYVLTDENGRQPWTCVEGPLEDWIKVAEAMKRREKVVYCHRCAAWLSSDGSRYYFYSPRNSIDQDEACLGVEDANTFADSILSRIGSGAGI